MQFQRKEDESSEPVKVTEDNLLSGIDHPIERRLQDEDNNETLAKQNYSDASSKVDSRSSWTKIFDIASQILVAGAFLAGPMVVLTDHFWSSPEHRQRQNEAIWQENQERWVECQLPFV